MSERLQVEVVRADELAVGDRVLEPSLGRFVDIEKIEQGDPVEWLRWKGEGWDSSYMRPDGHVLRVVRAPADPTAEQNKRLRGLAEWLVAMDEPGSATRRTITLTQIIDHARAALEAAQEAGG